MTFLPFLAAAAAITFGSATKLTRCGTSDPPQQLKYALDKTAFRYAINRNGSTRTVDTYAHVVTTQQKQGAYTDANIAQQMDVMNAAYGPSGFVFKLVGTDHTVNDAWAAAEQGSQTELEMKQELRKGSYSKLNLYFLSDLGGGLLGFCYFPEAAPTAHEKILDACVNLAGSMPGLGELPDYDLGLTTVHETAHWLALFHVFQGNSCSGKGDYVSDTPAQRAPTEGCPAQSDSCPGEPGLDSIHNFMDYSYDACLDSFTQKQNQRMFSIFDQFRAGE